LSLVEFARTLYSYHKEPGEIFDHVKIKCTE